jgi:hypothetical protein
MIVVKAGDYGYPLNFVIYNPKDSTHSAPWLKDVTTYTGKFKVWKPGTPDQPLVEGACTKLLGTDGIMIYTVLTGDFDKADVGNWEAEVELTKSGVVESTLTTTLVVEESPVTVTP